MNVTRRKFIKTMGLAALATASFSPFSKVAGQARQPLDDLFQIPPESLNDPLAYLTQRHFQAFINTSVRVTLSNGRKTELQLIEVNDLKRDANLQLGYAGESFSLVFKSLKRFNLPQNTYRIEHDSLGEFSLLLVPAVDESQFVAIINRINT